jgi:centromere/kinetochore protein ZW10
MAKFADLMIKKILIPAISNISVTVSVNVLEKSGSSSSVSVLIIAPSEELQVRIP